MRTSVRGLRLIEAFEGFSDRRYLDAVGVPTIGYGTTAADVSPLPATCTRAQAEGWLATNVTRKYAPSVNALRVPLNQNQFDALVSLAYNCGPGVFEGTIGRDLRARDYKAASEAFLLYVHAGGRVLQGLVNRREAERRLFDTPVRPVDPYAIFKDFVVHEFGRPINERAAVELYDRLERHSWRNRKQLNSLRGDLAFLRDRLRVLIAVDAHRRGQKVALAYSDRGARLAGLVKRTGNWPAWTRAH